MQSRKLIAELVGTFLLVFVALGSAISLDANGGGKAVGVALTFGFVLVAIIYAIGPVSGAHVNPAITLAMVIRGRQAINDAIGYWIAQIIGAVVAAGLLKLLVSTGGVTDQTKALATNSYDNGSINLTGALILEIVLTFVLVLTVLLVTDDAASAGFAGVAIGLVLTAVHLVGIPLTGTSVNPARSIGPALFQGGTALSQLWLFIVAPLAGGALAALLHPFVRASDESDATGTDTGRGAVGG